jgi:uncharacterized protein (TIGR02246 family)
MSISSMSPTLTDEAALRRVPERTTEAWARHDASAFADAFTADAKVVIAGTYLRGRDEIRSYMAAAFSGPIKGTTVVSNPISLEYINADTGLVITEGGVVLSGEAGVSAARAIRGTWVLTENDGEWRIHAYHSSPIPQS